MRCLVIGLMICIVSTRGLINSAMRPSRPVARSRACRVLNMNAEMDTYETSAVVLAARKGKAELLAELLSADPSGANLAVRCEKIANMDGATPIIWAARQGKSAVVQILLDVGADVNAATGGGWTALYVAALNGHEDIVALLVSCGAEVKAAMNVGDDRTNLNLQRMLEEADLASAAPAALRQQPMSASPPFAAAVPPPGPPPAPAAAPAPSFVTETPPLQPAVDPSDWKAAARSTVQTTSASSSQKAFFGMGELDAMKLRLEWRAPPTAEEQAAAEAARQTVFKYRHDRIKELQAATAIGRAGSSAAADTTWAGSPTIGSPTPGPPIPASPSAAQRPITEDAYASLLARLASLEARLTATGGGYESGYSKGFAEGFAAGRAAG